MTSTTTVSATHPDRVRRGRWPLAVPATMLAACLVALAMSGPADAQNAPIDITSQGAAAKKPPAKVKPNAKAVDPAATAALGELTPQQIVQNANGYFNGMKSFVSDFVQVNEDGRRFKGKLFVERPGKMRFDYAPPAKVVIVSDGSTVAIVDERLKTKDRYSVSETPLKFLIQKRIDLGRDLKVIRARTTDDEATILLEDKTTFGGTSRVNLMFDRQTFTLTGWSITDAQGVTTTVQVANIVTGRNIPEKTFEIGSEDLLLNMQRGNSN
jgi:outer membrane lipoprotein-sorting protein